MNKPDYEGGCIVNLANSIVKALGGNPVNPELDVLPAEQITEKNVVLLVIDGMGYEFLRKRQDSFLWKNTKERMTSVFPSSTPCAMTGLYSGLTPQQHGIPEWYAYLEEVDAVTIPLPFETRETETPLEELGLEPEELYDFETIFENMTAESYALQPDHIKDTKTSDFFLRGAERFGFKKIENMLGKAKELCDGKSRKFVFCYWSELDSHIHSHGNDHEKVEKHFREVDAAVKEFSEELENTLLLVTADHGLTNVKEEDTLIINDEPEILELLEKPLTGGSRTSFVYVKDKEKFRKLVGDRADIFEPEELLETGFFGRGEVHPKYRERLGDLAVLMKEGNGIKDFLEGEEYDLHKGRHGGLSDDEIFVPLIII